MAEQALYVITHIDFTPPSAEAGGVALAEHVAVLRAHPDVLRVELLQQVFRKNHYELLTVWSSSGALEASLSSDAVRDFRERIHAGLGSPYDERLHILIAA